MRWDVTGCNLNYDNVLFDDCLWCCKNWPVASKERKTLKRKGEVKACRQGEREGKWWKEDSGGNGKWQQGTGLTYMRWVGLQGGNTLLWVGGFPFREIGLQAWAGLIHRHGPTGPRRLTAFQGRGAGGVRVVWSAGDLIDIGCDLPPERGVLALQSL